MKISGFVLYSLLLWLFALMSLVVAIEDHLLSFHHSVFMAHQGERLARLLWTQVQTVFASSETLGSSQQWQQTVEGQTLHLVLQPWQPPVVHVIAKLSQTHPQLQRCEEFFLQRVTGRIELLGQFPLQCSAAVAGQ